MMLDTIKGNEQTVSELKKALCENKLMHAVLICGAVGMGAGYAGRCLAADYLYPNGDEHAQNAVMNGQSGEYLVVVPEGAAGEIKIDAVRNVRKNLFSTALSSESRVVHIKNAHKLNGAGANALLKVLEEPPPNVLFVLTAPGEATVIETIRSRCATYQMSGTSEAQCEEFLLSNYPKTKNIKTLAGEYAVIFGGKIGTCIYFLNNKNGEKIIESAKNFFVAVQTKNAYETASILSVYEKDKLAAKDFLNCIQDYCANILRNSNENEKDFQKTATKIIDEAYKMNIRYSQNANAKLALCNMAINLVKN